MPEPTETHVSTDGAARDQVVTFTKPYLSYNVGESAAFSADEATRLGELGVVDAPAATAPVNTTVPAVTQAADVLSCTMGEWEGVPTSYAYAWQIDGLAVGTDSSSHTVLPADVGKTAVCVVTATNAAGSTEAPPSSGVTIA